MAKSPNKMVSRCGVLIEQEIRDLQLIEFPEAPTPEEETACYKPASYDLRLGAQYVVPGEPDVGTDDAKIRDCRKAGALTIAPFGSVVVCTYEAVNLPANVVGKFNLRIKQALRGLIVQMGTQVEPNYHGPLFALLQNITSEPIKLKYKDHERRLFTIEFYYTTHPTKAERVEVGGIAAFLRSIRLSKTLHRILEQTREDQDAGFKRLGDRIGEAEGAIQATSPFRLAFYGFVLSVVVAAVITGVATIIAPWTLTKTWDIPLSEIKAAVAASDTLKKLAETVRVENELLKRQIEEIQKNAAANEETLKQFVKKLSDLERNKPGVIPAVTPSSDPKSPGSLR